MTEITVDDGEILLYSERELHEAAKHGDLEKVESLVSKGVNVNAMDEKDRIALHLAAGQGHDEVVLFLLDNDAKVDWPDKYGMNALLWAAWFGHHKVLDALSKANVTVKCENKLGLNILHCAAMRGNIEVMKYIVENLIDEDAEEDEEAASDTVALDSTQDNKLSGMFGRFKSGVSLLSDISIVKKDETPKVRDDSSQFEKRTVHLEGKKTPFHLAAENGCTEVLQYLIIQRCKKFARTEDGCLAIQLAAKGGHVDAVKLLIENELEVDCRNVEGKTALHFAAEEGHPEVVDLLLQSNAEINAKSNVRVYSEKTMEMCAIHFAALNEHVEVIGVLAKHTCRINIRNMPGNTALHMCALLEKMKSLKSLLDWGCAVNAINKKKRTALHEATENNVPSVVEMLLLYGADVALADKSGKTPISIAARADNVTIVDMLIKAERYMKKKKDAEENGGVPPKPVTQFRKDTSEQNKQMKPIIWSLATENFKQNDWKKLAFHWGFTEAHVKAIGQQHTGQTSWKEHTYRMLLIWLHGCQEHPLRELFEALSEIGKVKLAEKIRKQANKNAGYADNTMCLIS
ncbi:uncharacterized protein [Antedon mediterranea]|uniref:uncharacterized protein n=1 Tax=Antedon mediterranea TaxID=105859 RepID=UPI003AF6DC7B